jgi:uncharacterized membrane protein YgcG
MNHPSRLTFVCLFTICFTPFPAHTADEPLLPRPQTHVLDQANVLLPEIAANLSAEFTKASQENSLNIYLLTIPNLKASSVDRKAALENVADQYAGAWIQGTGALILFDDQSGLVSVAYSTEAKQLYSEVALDTQLREPLQAAQTSGLTREKLDRASRSVLRAMEKLKHETVLKTPGEHPVVKFIGGFLLLLAIVLVVHHSLNRKPAAIPVESKQGRTRKRKKHDKW